jgi:hypothetical protein
VACEYCPEVNHGAPGWRASSWFGGRRPNLKNRQSGAKRDLVEGTVTALFTDIAPSLLALGSASRHTLAISAIAGPGSGRRPPGRRSPASGRAPRQPVTWVEAARLGVPALALGQEGMLSRSAPRSSGSRPTHHAVWLELRAALIQEASGKAKFTILQPGFSYAEVKSSSLRGMGDPCPAWEVAGIDGTEWSTGSTKPVGSTVFRIDLAFHREPVP